MSVPVMFSTKKEAPHSKFIVVNNWFTLSKNVISPLIPVDLTAIE